MREDLQWHIMILETRTKDLIKKYLKTKDGFKKVVNQMQLKKDDFVNMQVNLANRPEIVNLL